MMSPLISLISLIRPEVGLLRISSNASIDFIDLIVKFSG
jgi:hypothetical protein